MIKLIALDMDGTALDNEKKLSGSVREAIEKALAAGIHVVPTTGRAKWTIPQSVLDIQGMRYAITSNGATIWDLPERDILAQKMISSDDAWEIVSFARRFQCYIELLWFGKVYTEEKMIQNPERYTDDSGFKEYVSHHHNGVEHLGNFLTKVLGVEKMNIYYLPKEIREKVESRLRAQKKMEISHSLGGGLELTAAGVNKGMALETICSILKISPEETAAIGDSDNDISMMKYAGHKIAMGNANDRVKEIADWTAPGNGEDGAAAAILHCIEGTI